MSSSVSSVSSGSRVSSKFDRSKFAKIRQKGVSGVSRTSTSSVSSPSRFSANKIAPSGYSEKILAPEERALGEEVRRLLINSYNEIDITKGGFYYYNKELRESLKELLKLLTKECHMYIDKVFAGYTKIKNYDLKDFERTYQYLYNKTKKTYYETLLRMSSIGCKNRDRITSIYYYLYGTINTNKYSEHYREKMPYNPEIMKKNLKQQLLYIYPMTPYIRNIIESTPLTRLEHLSVIPEASSHTGGKTNKEPQQPTKILFGKVRCIYKKSGDKKEYIKYKGLLITVKQYRDIRTRATKNRGK